LHVTDNLQLKIDDIKCPMTNRQPST